MKKFLVGLLVFCFLLLFGEGVYYFRLTKTLPWQKTPIEFTKVKLGEYVAVENVYTYSSPDEKTNKGYLIPGRVFRVIGQKREWLEVEILSLQTNDYIGGRWVRASKTAYKSKK